MPKSLLGVCQMLSKVILMSVQCRTLCLELSVPEELVKNPCVVCIVRFQQREIASSQNQSKMWKCTCVPLKTTLLLLVI